MKPVMVTARSRRGLEQFPAYPTGVPGLVVARTPDAGRCAGKWQVVHARSGLALSYCLPEPEAALGAAQAVAGVADWQLPAEVVRPVVRSGAVARALAAYASARCMHGLTPDGVQNDNGVIA